jgi:hypothetical protein
VLEKIRSQVSNDFQKKMGVIYICTSPSGKQYIGQHNSGDFKHRLYTHKYNFTKYAKARLILELNRKFYPNKDIPPKPTGYCTCLYDAFCKYGFYKFNWKILHSNIPKDKLNELEDKEIIDKNTISPYGYNLKLNKGNNFSYSETSRKLMSESQKKACTKYLHKYRRKNKELEGMPKHITYFSSGGIRGYRVVGHPNCRSRQFADKKTPIHILKQRTMEFMETIKNKPYISDQQRQKMKGFVKGIREQKPGKFCAVFTYNKKQYSKYFSKFTRDENLKLATIWITNKKKEIYEKGSETK